MRCSLPQTKESLERGQHATFRELVGHLLLGSGTNRVVDAPLRLIELDVKNGLRSRRELGQNFTLQPSQDERAYLRAKARRRFGVAVRDRPDVSLLEGAAPAKQTWIREMHHAPELLEPVLDR